MKILLATDGSPFSDAAVEEVAHSAWPPGSEVKIVAVVEPPFVPAAEPWVIPPQYIADIEKGSSDRAVSSVNGALSKLRSDGDKTLKLTTAMPTGSPKTVIIDEAEKWGADLIILGSHGYGAWDRFLLGSVSNAVVSHAKCSVEIVRRPHAA